MVDLNTKQFSYSSSCKSGSQNYFTLVVSACSNYVDFKTNWLFCS